MCFVYSSVLTYKPTTEPLILCEKVIDIASKLSKYPYMKDISICCYLTLRELRCGIDTGSILK